MPDAEIRAALDLLGGQSILVVGDAMLDRYVWGTATRISPEAPVPVVRERERSASPGGAANTAANVVGMGVDATLLAVVGDDEAGRDLGELIDASGVHPHLIACPDRPTTAKTRVMAGSHQVARIDAEKSGGLPAEVEAELLGAVDSLLSDADAVLISDYAKGSVSEEVAQRVIGAAQERGLPVVVDPKGASFEKYLNATLITPNEAEARLAAGLSGDTEMDMVANRLSEILPGSDLLITRGEAGMTLHSATGQRLDVPAIAHRVHDVTGAGDTVAAALVVAMAAGVAIPIAVHLANVAAAEAVQQVGVARITQEELRKAFTERSDESARSAAES